METEGSLPHSQIPATCLYPKPAQSSPYPTPYFLKIHFNIILPSTPGIPVGARFFAHVQPDPGAHLASCTMGTGSFAGVKRPGRGADHPPPPSAEVEND
jgi:hypothetical protein